MALRRIAREGEDCLTRVCRPVEKFDERLSKLIDDMMETLVSNEGVGLAAPQIGVLRRLVVINTGEQGGIKEFINPEIVLTEGEQEAIEGCLSCPGEYGYTSRPAIVKVKAFDRQNNEFEMQGTDLLARAFCHELDHLEGKLFKDKVVSWIEPEDIKSSKKRK